MKTMNHTLCTITVTLTTIIREVIRILIEDSMEEIVTFSRLNNGKSLSYDLYDVE